MSFKVNDKVVLVDLILKGTPLDVVARTMIDYEYIGAVLKVGGVYVVEAILPTHNGVGLKLVGSTTVHKPTGYETGFHPACFRKLEEVQEENEIKAMLEEATQLINLY